MINNYCDFKINYCKFLGCFMIKVIELIHGLSMGGAEKLVKEYALGLNKNKYDVIVLCYERCESPYTVILKSYGIKVINICNEMPLYGKNTIVAKMINYIYRIFLMKKYIKKLNPDIIHVHLPLCYFIKFARPRKSTGIVYTQHNTVKRWKEEFPRDVRNLKWIIKHYPTQLIALHLSMKKELDDLFHISNTLVLNNGVDIKKLRQTREQNIVKKEIGLPEKAFLMGHVGRFNKVKNHVFLLDIFVEVCKRRDDAFLLLVGNGETKNEIKKKIAELGLLDKVIILSDRTDIPDLMNAMDVMVLPSISEGLSIVCIEAQIVGTRCIVADTIPKETIISNLIMFLSLSCPAQFWAEQVLQNKDQVIQYYDIEQWDMKVVIRKLEEIYFTLYQSSRI